MFAAACGDGGGARDGTGSSAEHDPTTTMAAGAPSVNCPAMEPAAEPDGPSADAVALSESDGGGDPRVEAVVYPRPDYEGELWTQWGQGVVLADGRFVSAIGDHDGVDGNSFLFVYDPEDRRITRFADVLDQVEHEPGAWGYGKIHAQMALGPCDEVYVATYWGTREGIRYESTYEGDILFRLDPATLTLEELGSPLPEHGLPSMGGSASEGLIYAEAVDPEKGNERTGDRGSFIAYDVTDEQVVFETDDRRHTGFRNILVDAEGTAYLAADDGRLLAYEPGSNELTESPHRLPGGGWLRASTTPAPDGSVYGVTQDPDRFFALRPDGEIDELGAAREYTTSLALDPDGDRFFYVPGAHGDAWEQGAPVIAVDTQTGEQTVVVELNDLAERELDLTLGGSYNVVVDPSGDRLFVGFNAGPDEDDPWGEVVLAIIHL